MAGTAAAEYQVGGEKAADFSSSHILRMIGDDLDNERAPTVFTGGAVWPTAALANTRTQVGNPKEVIKNGRGEFKPRFEAGSLAPGGGPAAGARQGTASGGATDTRRQASTFAPQFCATHLASPKDEAIVPGFVRAELESVSVEYPQLMLYRAEPGLWLSGPLTPLPGSCEAAHLVLAIPFRWHVPVRAWAWWEYGVAIGPRHCNPDGSICAYEPRDRYGNWARGQSLVKLLDMISIWVLRQMYLRAFQRWPGLQFLHTPFERLECHRLGEYCGCGSAILYDDCHRPSDERLSARELQADLPVPVSALRRSLRSRCPPRTQEEMVRAASASLPPSI